MIVYPMGMMLLLDYIPMAIGTKEYKKWDYKSH